MCPERPPMPQVRAARRALGFTLIEVIVIVLVVGLLGALVVNLMGTQLLRASNPATIASDAGDAETALEAVMANYTNVMNNSTDTSTALNNLKGSYTTNSTVVISDATWNSVRTLTVTVTVGNTAYTTLLTQARTNATSDNPVDF